MKFLLIALMFFVPDADTHNYKMDTDNPSYRMKIGNENETDSSFFYPGKIFLPMELPAANDIRAGSGAPGVAYWQQSADHDIKVRLDIEEQFVTASEVITYTNNSPDELNFVWLQLEQNVHRADSVRSRESSRPEEKDFEGIVISRLEVDGETVEWHDYATLARVDLTDSIESGETASIAIDWTFPFPVKAGLRMGYDDAYDQGAVWEFAQWFPTPCVYDDVHGWNALPYIGRGEFYTNFGDYTVEITVPRDHIVMGSGELTNPGDVLTPAQHERLKEAMVSDELVEIRTKDEVGDPASRPAGEGDLTWKFKGDQIRTFAWATSASYRWDAASVEIASLDGSPTRVLCMSGYPNDVSDYWDEAVEYVQHAIEYYSDTIYPYPWPQMSVVRGRAGGMEYPMLVFCRGRDHQSLFNVTDHEVGHDWFPMLINNDERRHAWMDEGFNTFVNHYSLEEYYGDRKHRPDVSKYDAGRFKNDYKAINTPPDYLYSRGHLSYRKPGYGLRFLREEVVGEERFDAAFKEYARRWAFKAPRPADFYRTMEDVIGMDLQWFFKGFFESTMQLDQGISRIHQRKRDDLWSVNVTIDNHDEWVCPVDLVFYCADDSVHTFHLPVSVWAWSTRHNHKVEIPSRAVKVVIDPREAYPDINRSNNVYYATPH